MFNKKFTELLPRDYKINMYRKNIDNGIHLILYISDKKLDLNDIKNNSIGYIEYIFDQIFLEITILYMGVDEKYKNKGIGSFLILLVADMYKNICKVMELDDMSENAWGKNNLYLNMGFKYINKKPFPEMKGYPLNISKKYNYFYTKYCKKNKFFK